MDYDFDVFTFLIHTSLNLMVLLTVNFESVDNHPVLIGKFRINEGLRNKIRNEFTTDSTS